MGPTISEHVRQDDATAVCFCVALNGDNAITCALIPSAFRSPVSARQAAYDKIPSFSIKKNDRRALSKYTYNILSDCIIFTANRFNTQRDNPQQ